MWTEEQSKLWRLDRAQWDTNISQHPMSNKSTMISTGIAKPGKLFNKICQDRYFWEEKIWLGLSWLLGTWFEYTSEYAELCHLCISAYGTEIYNIILAVNMVLILHSWVAIISVCLPVASRFKKKKKKKKATLKHPTRNLYKLYIFKVISVLSMNIIRVY